jgi:DNA-binding response OmpR family regulator
LTTDTGVALMTSSSTRDSAVANPSDELKGLHVLIVEDSWQVGTGLKEQLEAWGADVAGPVATNSDAERLVSKSIPDVALVDINLRRGELSYDLIDRLHAQGVRVVVITGFDDVLLEPGKVAAILQKPLREDLLLAALLPLRAA